MKHLFTAVAILLVVGSSYINEALAGEIKEVAIIGNSIRWHGPLQQLGWNGKWGMAATAEEKDYVHILHRKICDKLAQTQKQAPRLFLPPGNIVEERTFSSWHPEMIPNADIIIIQLGDNYRGPVTEEKLQKSYEAMLKDFKAARSNAILLCTSNWEGSPIANLIKAAAGNQGVPFVDLRPLSADPRNKAKSENNFTNGGVNWHPGDRGMNAIAEAIWAKLEPLLDQREQSGK